MKRNPLTLIIGLLLIVIFGFLLFTFQVRTTDVAVVTTFGKPTRPITEPNLYCKWPWPIQRVWTFDRRVQNFEDRLTEGLTLDHFNLLTSVYVGWRVSDPATFFPRFAGSAKPMAAAEALLDQWLGNAKTAAVGRHPLSDFVSTTDDGAAFLAIENEILQTIQSQILTNNLGLQVEFLGLKRLQLPESVSQSVFDRMTSERKVLADGFQYEGEAEAQRIRSEAERRAAEVLSNAKARATGIEGEGEAEAAKSLKVFQQNPELASFIFRLSALEDSLKQRSTLIFDQRTSPFNLFGTGSTNLLTK
ncbi:MAG TPA: protease modulator HflC [Candidatus Paceibacterota bacterium]|nr:protease modulator HflC [Verrucomicrobiota bacterium]HSA10733.1 protease modulator HflC [Candidatus Paceibacterota bacterium]